MFQFDITNHEKINVLLDAASYVVSQHSNKRKRIVNLPLLPPYKPNSDTGS